MSAASAVAVDLDFACTGAHPDLGAAGPTIALQLRIRESTGTPVQALALRCQLRIEPVRRGYDESETAALRDLFGDRARWAETLKPFQLGYLNHVVPGFTGQTEVTLPLTCSYDVDVAAHKYLYGVADGEVPLLLLFSGTVFTAGEHGMVVQPVPWHKEASYRLPVRIWQQTMELHFPGTAWLRLGRETFDALQAYRTGHQLLTADEALRRLLAEAGP
jgi:hypothetical protein